VPKRENPVTKALWFIEAHPAEETSLDSVADAAGVSRYHMSRAFGLATGLSLMNYIRGRRLTGAARSLAAGADDILTVALDAGYGSHEAFTRAFRDQFGLTPETLRNQNTLEHIQLVEPIQMKETVAMNLDAPRMEDAKSILITGLSERCGDDMNAPAQWQRFVPHIGHIPNQIGFTTYGVLHNCDDAGNMEYLCGVQVSDFSRTPKGLTNLRLPDQKYAVFFHAGHVSTIRTTWQAIFTQWLPESGFKAAGGPEFERYTERFNPMTGAGGVEIWIPVAPAAS
jgi:AraC family transcriptional regulator